MVSIVLYILAALAAAGAVVYLRAAGHRRDLMTLIETRSAEAGQEKGNAYSLAMAAYRKEMHAAILYMILVPVMVLVGALSDSTWRLFFVAFTIPTGLSIWWSRLAVSEARMARNRYEVESRYHQALEQKDLAPKAWAARLAPEQVPDFTGFEIGRVYEAGSGLMSGDFFDVHRLSDTRVAAVIGDVAGHNIESSLTAFQAKYLLRVFLRQFRDPAQAFEELNEQLATGGDRHEEFISACVVVFDTEAGTLRYASAGHPAILLFQQDGVQSLRSTGPLLMLDPHGTYFSKEIQMETGDLVIMYTDGLSEARATSGGTMFSESRIIKSVEREINAAPDVLCKMLLDAAKDFARGTIEDDTAIMAVRRD